MRNNVSLAGTINGTRGLSVAAAAMITVAILVMTAASVVRGGWMRPPLVMPAAGPPWELSVGHVSVDVVTYSLWLAAIVGAAGVVSGLVAIQRGARPSARLLLIAGLLAVSVLTVLPATGSTDALDYATYGRLLALGHNPYVVTPEHLRHLHTAFSRSVPGLWSRSVSVYGPFATMEQFVAAKLGGASMARIVFWLKLVNAAAFATVALVADRVLRANPAQRLRAHLLWTVNPLLLWNLIAAGHVNVLAAAAGLLGLLVLGEQAAGSRPPLPRVLAAGALLGIAAGIKVNYLLLGLGLAWALRRCPARLAIAAGASLAVLVPGYAWFGWPALRALAERRNSGSADSFYRVFLPHIMRGHLALIATVLVVALAGLALRRLPARLPERPAVRPAIALTAAWLFLWPFQLPWYDVMIIGLLLLYPASRLDWLVLARLTAATIANMPGNPFLDHSHVLTIIDRLAVHVLAPLVLLGAAAGLVVLCVSGRWRRARLDRPVEIVPEPLHPAADPVGS